MKIQIKIYYWHGNVHKHSTKEWLEKNCSKGEDEPSHKYDFYCNSFGEFVEKWNDKFLCIKADEPNTWFVYITDHSNFSQR